ncbi:hypothetical protein AGMMS49992_31970 [Clostridia bacterium]|nr:hypothetical protein AGMMS49992_31970 [Clostridia bacterium]
MRVLDELVRFKANRVAFLGMTESILETTRQRAEQLHIQLTDIPFGDVYDVADAYGILTSLCDAWFGPTDDALRMAAYPRIRDRMLGRLLPNIDKIQKISLRGAYNAPLFRSSWRANDYDLRYLDSANALQGSVPFRVTEGVADALNDPAMILIGQAEKDADVLIPLNLHADRLHLLHAVIPGQTGWEYGYQTYLGKRIGTYEIRFTDGDSAEVPLIFGQNISLWKNPDNILPILPDAWPIYHDTTPDGLPYTLYAHVWRNPRPEAEIASLTLRCASDKDTALALLGLTATRDAPCTSRQPALTHSAKGAAPSIWPIPNAYETGVGVFSLRQPISCTYDPEFVAEAELIRNELSELIQLNMEDTPVQSSDIRLEKDPTLATEAYQISISEQAVILRAATPQGAQHAVYSFIQLCETAQNMQIPAMRISDAPLLPIRGVHLYIPPRENIAWLKRLINLLARYKMNTIFLEIGASMQFERHPEINTAWEHFCSEMMRYPDGPDADRWANRGMQVSESHIKNSVHIENGGRSFLSKTELAEIAAHARKRHIEIIPEIQGLSHAYWMLLAHPELAERSGERYPDTYCPSNPESYKLLFDCMDEIIEVLQPRMVHIGHDELYSLCLCETCKGRSGHDIFAEDVNRIYTWLAARGIRVALWSDKLMDAMKVDPYEYGGGIGGAAFALSNRKSGRNENVPATYKAAELIPNDVLLTDWYYATHTRERVRSEDLFGRRGFKEIFGNFRTNGFDDLENRLRAENVYGAEVSNWHETSPAGFAAANTLFHYLDAANVLWYSGYRSAKRPEYLRRLARLYPQARDILNGRSSLDVPVHYIPLPLPATITEPMPSEFQFIKAANPIVEVLFILNGHWLSVDQSPCIIPIGQMLSSLIFLHTYTKSMGSPPMHACTYFGAEEDTVGRYTVVYADGGIVEIPLLYGQNIAHYEGEFSAAMAHPAFVASTPAPHAACRTLYALTWQNPRPDVPIRELQIIPKPLRPGTIGLLALTGAVS